MAISSDTDRGWWSPKPAQDENRRGVEGIAEYAIYRQVKGTRLGLVHHEGDYRLGSPLCELHFRNPRPHPADVAAEGIGQEVLPCPVELELLGDLGCLFEGLPSKAVDLAVVAALLVAHDQL